MNRKNVIRTLTVIAVVLLLGWSDILYDVLRELNAHSTVGSKVMVIADLDEKTLAVKLGESLRSGLKNLALDFRLADATEREAYAELDLTSYDSLVVLADETTKDDADTRALRVLLRLSEHGAYETFKPRFSMRHALWGLGALGSDSGRQNTYSKTNNLYAWAVRSGDVSAVPVPAAIWLFGSGLLGITGIARRKAA